MSVRAPQQKFGPKIKNFEIFFDIIDNHNCVNMCIKKNFKIFYFLAKFLNYLKGPSVEYLISLFFELTHMYVNQKPRRLSGALTFGLGPTVGSTVWPIFLHEQI